MIIKLITMISYALYGTTYTALSYAVADKKKDFMESLLTIEGIDLDGGASSKPPLVYAIDNDDETLVKRLMDLGANPGKTFFYYSDVYNCLSYAISRKKSYALICSLIKKDDVATIAGRDCTRTPLYNAVANNDQSVVQALVDAGADVSTTFVDYKTTYDAVSYALAKKQSDAVVQALLSSSTCDTNYKKLSQSPYFYALYNKNPAMVQALIDRGYNVNRKFSAINFFKSSKFSLHIVN